MLVPGLAAALEPLDEAFAKTVLIVSADAFACHRFDVYLALDQAQRARGLMFVRDLPARTGMLFVYEDDAYLSMWMKNTYIPLDMLFARADGSVATVVRGTEPLSLRSVVASEPVRYVLELNAGTSTRLGLGRDSRLAVEAVALPGS